VNTEQASKSRRGCRLATITRKADGGAEASVKSRRRIHRGSGGSTHGYRSTVQQGKSVVVIDRQLINDDLVRGGVGRCGWRMGA
jgi:hypothetical protein